MAVARPQKTGRKSPGPSHHDTTEAAPDIVAEAGSRRLSNGSFNPPQSPESKVVTRGITRILPVTKLRTIHQTAEILQTSKRTVQRLIASGQLRAHRFRRLVRVTDADIAALLDVTRIT